MKQRSSIFTVALFLVTNSLFSQNISGIWEGELVQPQSSIQSNYKLTLRLKHVGKKIEGTATIAVDSLLAEVELVGKELKKNIFELTETVILRHTEGKNQEWCLGKFNVVLQKSEQGKELIGTFDSKTTFSTCPISIVRLHKGLPRA